jgi:hypothetical protein
MQHRRTGAQAHSSKWPGSQPVTPKRGPVEARMIAGGRDRILRQLRVRTCKSLTSSSSEQGRPVPSGVCMTRDAPMGLRSPPQSPKADMPSHVIVAGGDRSEAGPCKGGLWLRSWRQVQYLTYPARDSSLKRAPTSTATGQARICRLSCRANCQEPPFT